MPWVPQCHSVKCIGFIYDELEFLDWVYFDVSANKLSELFKVVLKSRITKIYIPYLWEI